MPQEFAVCACVAGGWGKEEGAEVVVEVEVGGMMLAVVII